MCGISGWQIASSLKGVFSDEVDTMSSHLMHRGPDGSGLFHSTDKTLLLGHNRLSIIDLSSLGSQPMISERGDVLVFNGEIYNFRALRLELISKGHTFNSESDSEVLLRSLMEWGIDCLQRIKGMYAFAYWNEGTQTLHLARDPMGIKPLYYWRLPEQKGVVFASEIQAIAELGPLNPVINRNSLGQYLEFGYTINAMDTIFKDVLKLQPGHRIEVKDRVLSGQIRHYSPILTPFTDKPYDEIEEDLYSTLSEVVEEHLVADVPVGLLLSGGLDSSLLAAIASKKSQINTYTMGFENSPVDERQYAETVANYIGSKHHSVLLSPDQILQDIESVSRHFDDIFADWGMVSTRLLYQRCRDQGIKVVLVGEGSDELFGGYEVFRNAAAYDGSPSEWQLFQLYRNYAGRRYGRQYIEFRSVFKQHLKAAKGNYFSAMRLFETRSRLPNNFVMKVDKASMAVGVEARTPFLDSRVADLAYRIPATHLIDQHEEKKILKSIARRYNLLPDQILNRNKYGASIAANWIDDSRDFRDFARDIILAKDSWVDEVGLRSAMQTFFDSGQTGYRFPRAISIFHNLAWRLLILNLWSKSLKLSR